MPNPHPLGSVRLYQMLLDDQWQCGYLIPLCPNQIWAATLGDQYLKWKNSTGTSGEKWSAPKEITCQTLNETAREDSHALNRLKWPIHFLVWTQDAQIESNLWSSYGWWVGLTQPTYRVMAKVADIDVGFKNTIKRLMWLNKLISAD